MHRLVLPSLAACCLMAFAGPARATDVLVHADTALALPTYDGSGQGVEPDVVWVPGGWHGYTHWMVVTPYTCGDETHENPSILASHDGERWDVPVVDGASPPQPLVANTESCPGYAFGNSDPTLVVAGDSLFAYYVVSWYTGPNRNTGQVRRVASADGVHWTPGASAPVMWTKPSYVLSPTVVRDGSSFRMWYIRSTSCKAASVEVHMRTSTDGLDWPNAADEVVAIADAPGVPFHLTVKPIDAGYAMLYTAYPANTNCTEARTLWYAESPDGANWTTLAAPMLTPNPAPGAWDARMIYRSSFAGRYPNLAVWYSAYGDSVCPYCGGGSSGPVWRVGYTEIGNYQAPMRISAVGPMSFGRVIAGAVPPQRVVAVANHAPPGAPLVTYAVAASTGFAATPSGDFTLAPGTSNTHVLSLFTDDVGRKTGEVTFTGAGSGGLRATLDVAGTVLRHAAPSLDSLATVRVGRGDLGARRRGQFPPHAVRIWNLDHHGNTQARLRVASARIDGGDGRFAVGGGFELAQIGDTSAVVDVWFADAGARAESTYTATLVLGTADEDLPGGLALDTLVVALSARIVTDDAREPWDQPLPAASRVLPARPNPAAGATTLPFDLATGARVRVEVFDVTGRKIAVVADRRYEPGRYAVRWDGRRDDGAPARTGLYLVRVSGEGVLSGTQRVTLVR